MSPLRSSARRSAGRSLSRNAIVPQPGAGPRNGAIGFGGCWFAGRIQLCQPCVDVDAASPKGKSWSSCRFGENQKRRWPPSNESFLVVLGRLRAFGRSCACSRREIVARNAPLTIAGQRRRTRSPASPAEPWRREVPRVGLESNPG